VLVRGGGQTHLARTGGAAALGVRPGGAVSRAGRLHAGYDAHTENRSPPFFRRQTSNAFALGGLGKSYLQFRESRSAQDARSETTGFLGMLVVM